MWYIAWCSMETGCEGRGKAVYSTREGAQEWINQLNVLYPHILHWPIKE